MRNVLHECHFGQSEILFVSCRLSGCGNSNIRPGSLPCAWSIGVSGRTSTGRGAYMQVRGHQWDGTCCCWPQNLKGGVLWSLGKFGHQSLSPASPITDPLILLTPTSSSRPHLLAGSPNQTLYPPTSQHKAKPIPLQQHNEKAHVRSHTPTQDDDVLFLGDLPCHVA